MDKVSVIHFTDETTFTPIEIIFSSALSVYIGILSAAQSTFCVVIVIQITVHFCLFKIQRKNSVDIFVFLLQFFFIFIDESVNITDGLWLRHIDFLERYCNCNLALFTCILYILHLSKQEEDAICF